jgi:hypothetical protein
MESRLRRKLPLAAPGVAPFLRASDVRPLAPSGTSSSRLPTVLALHAAMMVSGAMLGCGGSESGDGIEPDRHVRVVASSTKPLSSASASATPGTQTDFIPPDPHEVDGQRMLVVPPAVPSGTAHIITTAPTTAPTPTWKGPKTAGVRPPVRPHPIPSTGGAAIGGTPPCPPPAGGANPI